MRLAALLLMLSLSGCVTPYLGYQHISNPNVDGDGLDLICGGVKHQYKQLETRGSWCQKLHYDQVIQLEVNIDLLGE